MKCLSSKCYRTKTRTKKPNKLKYSGLNHQTLLFTILCEFGGADQSGDLKEVLADGAGPQGLGVFPCGRISLFLQLQLGGRDI